VPRPDLLRHRDDHDHDHGHDEFGGGVDELRLVDPRESPTWALDHVELTTVGIDIGSATSSVMFARLLLKRKSETMSSRFEVVRRDVLYRSPITFTGYASGDLIDIEAVREMVAAAYAGSGLTDADIDTGVVILTGTALLRHNARAIGELLADEGGKFVSAAAGHNLEALFAAHGAGAVSRSAAEGTRVVSLDVGGGTTKLALVDAGTVRATAAIAGGGRLLAWDDQRRLTRVEPYVLPIAASLGLAPHVGKVFPAEAARAVAARLAGRALAALAGKQDDLLAGGLPDGPAPDLVLLSGGVPQHLIEPAEAANDLGLDLARAIWDALAAAGHAAVVATNPIRATIIGASQFSAQVSGNTVRVSGGAVLPMRNLPIIGVDLTGLRDLTALAVTAALDASRTRLDLRDVGRVGYAVRWSARPSYANLRALADGLLAGHSPNQPLVGCVNADVAASLGALIADELGFAEPLVLLDGLDLAELDYLDVGELITPTNVVPVIIKSLLFTGSEHVTPSR
jgi:ethanolamine utilization protein EutA